MSAVAESAVIWKLKSVGAVTALVSTRIYPRIAPEGAAKPYIVVDRPPGQAIDHTLSGPGKFRKTPMVLYCVGDPASSGYQQSRAIAAAVAAALDTTGAAGSVTWNSQSIDHCWVTATYDASKPPSENDEIGWPIEAVDIELFHLEC